MDNSAPRKRGEARRPLLTARVVRGLARLSDAVPASLVLGDAEIAAALDYARRLATYESRPERIAQREAARALTEQSRKARKDQTP